LTTEKKGKFLSFLKAKAKPLKPRKTKTTFKLKTTLQNFKKRKVENTSADHVLQGLAEKYSSKQVPATNKKDL
jgi:hypothetical protein